MTGGGERDLTRLRLLTQSGSILADMAGMGR